MVRGDDMKIRAFHNICRHRGDRLVRNEGGCKKVFVCGFHGWTYNNGGKLVGMTDPTQFCGVDKDEYGLLEVAAEVWENIVF